MKLLVIGSGGREHALVWKLSQSSRVARIWCAPGNAGIAEERVRRNGEPVTCLRVGAEDLPRLLEFARANKPDLTVVGPDNPLALGVVDLFQKNGFPIWGPNQRAAQFEASKGFSQRFMMRHGIPTARGEVFSDPDGAKKFVKSLGDRCAVKADGLALGKGVIICTSATEAGRAIDDMLVAKTFGDAGARIVIQELLEGTEVSLHALCDGTAAKLFPTSQDHKRIFDGDKGPNTGGMGTYSPVPFLSETQLAELDRAILQPWLKGCLKEGIDFRGLLYPGLMLTKSGPKVIEFNTRFGDPETQVYLTRLENDLVELLQACIDGTLERVQLKWKSESSVCVVMASAGYPGASLKGKIVHGLGETASLPNVKIFHAGTKAEEDKIITSGGRVLGVTAWAGSLAAARSAAYAAVEKIRFDGAQFRRDIAIKAVP